MHTIVCGERPGAWPYDGAMTETATAQTAATAQDTSSSEAATGEAATGAPASFSSAGAIPPVAHASAAAEKPTASERAFGATAHAENAQSQAATVQWHGGEPLPVLKDLFFAPETEGNLRVFMGMIDHAPVRPGTHVRTPLSPQDGLATIITNFVIRICDKYLPWAKQRREPKHEQWLQHTISGHLVLLSTPSTGSHSGGDLTRGLNGKMDGLLGSTTPDDIAVNQTAITVLTLEQMRENPDPHYQHLHGKKIDKLLAKFTPELKLEVLRMYPPNKPPHEWDYNNMGKLEDQSHLKTTWSQLDALGRSKSKERAWYRAQADRIAKEAPHVKDGWDSQSGAAGSVRP